MRVDVPYGAECTGVLEVWPIWTRRVFHNCGAPSHVLHMCECLGWMRRACGGCARIVADVGGSRKLLGDVHDLNGAHAHMLA